MYVPHTFCVGLNDEPPYPASVVSPYPASVFHLILLLLFHLILLLWFRHRLGLARRHAGLLSQAGRSHWATSEAVPCLRYPLHRATSAAEAYHARQARCSHRAASAAEAYHASWAGSWVGCSHKQSIAVEALSAAYQRIVSQDLSALTYQAVQ